jgi:hypothetical protein
MALARRSGQHAAPRASNWVSSGAEPTKIAREHSSSDDSHLRVNRFHISQTDPACNNLISQAAPSRPAGDLTRWRGSGGGQARPGHGASCGDTPAREINPPMLRGCQSTSSPTGAPASTTATRSQPRLSGMRMRRRPDRHGLGNCSTDCSAASWPSSKNCKRSRPTSVAGDTSKDDVDAFNCTVPEYVPGFD